MIRLKLNTLFVGTVVCVLFFVGCSSFGGSRALSEPEVFTGLQGMVVDFEPEAPPDQIFEGDTVQMSFRLENKGAADVQQGLFTLLYDPTFLALTDNQQKTFSLTGRKNGDPQGGLTFLTSQIQALPLPKMTETMTVTVGGTFCYRYKTHASTEVCIDADTTRRQQKEKTCTVGPVSLSGGQGAPVTVDDVAVTMLSHPDNPELVKPQFTIGMANVGDGTLTSPGSLREACSPTGLTKEKINTVTVHAWLSDKALTCSGEEQAVRFKDNSASIRCSLDEGIPSVFGTYTSLLRIEIEYGYTTTKVKEMEIRKQSVIG